MAASRDWKRFTIGVYTCKREQRCYAARDMEHGSRGKLDSMVKGIWKCYGRRMTTDGKGHDKGRTGCVHGQFMERWVSLEALSHV